jgi:hypothetical protein
MSDTDQLRGLGQQLAADLVASYGATAPGAKLVFLPGGVSVPVDADDNMGLVQRSPYDPTKILVNPTQMQTWLSINFDSPFLVTPGDGSVLEKDSSWGSASQIYTIAVTSAQPLGAVGDDGWTRVDAEIAGALRKLGQPDATKSIVCEPGDWPLPSANAGYWTTFDSSATQTTSTQTATPVPAVRPQFWMVRSLATVAAPPPAPSPAPPPPAPAPPGPIGRRFVLMRSLQKMQVPMAARFSPAVSEMAVSPAASAHLEESAPTASAPAVHPQLQVAAWRQSAAAGLLAEKVNTQVLFQNYRPVQTVTTSTSSTIKIHLEHQCVSLGYYTAGQPWWDGVFLADQGWFAPGRKRGSLLPSPDGGPDAAYGLPVGLIIVQNLSVTGQWSAEAATALSSPGGTIGPLSLFGAIATTAADGVTVTYSHPGMQVVALLCNALPVLPPVDAPAAVAPTTAQPAPKASTSDPPPPPPATSSDPPAPDQSPGPPTDTAPPTLASDAPSAPPADPPSPSPT